MLLQRQYSLWKTVNTLLASAVVFMIILSVWFSLRTSYIEKSIKEANVKLLEINKEIDVIENSWLISKIKMVKMISNKDSKINYAWLYKFLYSIKLTLTKLLKSENITYNRFLLKVDRDKVTVSLMVPSYNNIYIPKSSILETIVWKNFVKRAEINSYKTKWYNARFVYFDLVLYTK